jgi:two-component sensor histidine kinase
VTGKKMGQLLRILIIEDNENDVILILREIRKSGFSPVWETVQTAAAMRKQLSQSDWDIIISDYSLPQFDGLTALKIWKKMEPDIPFILVSGTIGEDLAVEAMKMGARDYIMKDYLKRLGPAVKRELKEAELRRRRKRAEQMIKESLREKEILLKEINHRVKNNMQIILSLLRIESLKCKTPEVKEILKKSQDRIRTMALIHNSLYKSKDLAGIDFSAYVSQLTTHLLSLYHSHTERVKLILDIKDVFLDVNRAIPCGLIINELVTNAIKHGFKGTLSGELRIDMISRRDDQKTVLTIQNTGKEFPHSIDIQHANSTGLQLVQDLVRQLHGTIQLNRNPTTFIITF